MNLQPVRRIVDGPAGTRDHGQCNIDDGVPVTVGPGAGHSLHGQLAQIKSLVLGAW